MESKKVRFLVQKNLGYEFSVYFRDFKNDIIIKMYKKMKSL